MTGLPMQALDRHVDLVRFYRSRLGSMYAQREVEASLGLDDGMAPTDFLAAGLDVAETFALTDDVYAMLAEAKDSLPSFVLHADDLPAPHGYVHMEHPQVLLDRHLNPLVVTGLGWSGIRIYNPGRADGLGAIAHVNPAADSPLPPDAILLWLFTDPTDPRDHLYASGQPTLPTRGLSLLAGHMELGKPVNLSPDVAPLSMIPLLVSLFRFMQEPWLDGSPQRLTDRQAIKRAQRAGRDPEVRVVALRARPHAHADHGDPSGEGAGYSHRFVVRGHWRNQWYPSRGEHAPRWIPSYVKGPDDRPLVIKDRVFHVAR